MKKIGLHTDNLKKGGVLSGNFWCPLVLCQSSTSGSFFKRYYIWKHTSPSKKLNQPKLKSIGLMAQDSPEIDSYTCGQLIFDVDTKAVR